MSLTEFNEMAVDGTRTARTPARCDKNAMLNVTIDLEKQRMGLLWINVDAHVIAGKPE